jgi:hypothetical protein
MKLSMLAVALTATIAAAPAAFAQSTHPTPSELDEMFSYLPDDEFVMLDQHDQKTHAPKHQSLRSFNRALRADMAAATAKDLRWIDSLPKGDPLAGLSDAQIRYAFTGKRDAQIRYAFTGKR